MTNMAKKAVSVTSSALLLASMGAGAAVMATTSTASAAEATGAEAIDESSVSNTVVLDKVVGRFSFTQSSADTVDRIHTAMAKASQYLCGGQAIITQDRDVSEWVIDITGAVDDGYATTIGELQADDELVNQLIGCACAGNPVDGAASINAEVTGVSALTLIERAGIQEGANTVVFASADGYKVEIPLIYLQTHLCPVVFNVAGAPIVESMGGANQLWLGSTSARYFARDIVTITVEQRDEAPAMPGSEEAAEQYANLPNIGVDFGGEIA